MKKPTRSRWLTLESEVKEEMQLLQEAMDKKKRVLFMVRSQIGGVCPWCGDPECCAAAEGCLNSD